MNIYPLPARVDAVLKECCEVCDIPYPPDPDEHLEFATETSPIRLQAIGKARELDGWVFAAKDFLSAVYLMNNSVVAKRIAAAWGWDYHPVFGLVPNAKDVHGRARLRWLQIHWGEYKWAQMSQYELENALAYLDRQRYRSQRLESLWGFGWMGTDEDRNSEEDRISREEAEDHP